MTPVMSSTKPDKAPEYAYHILRGALETFHKGVSELTDNERKRVYRQADRTYSLESRVLASPEAQGVVIPSEELEQSISELSGRYASHEEFVQDLNRNGVTEDTLAKALRRELMFNAVMQKLASQASTVSDVDIELFYEMHVERFDIPEVRHARHILITVNADYAENEREAAHQRIEELQQQAAANPLGFDDLAMKHSECPTALQGGTLGKLKRGMLYPELEQVLFRMEPGTVSEVVESEVGFHILLCEQVDAPRSVPLEEVRDNIRHKLEERAVRKVQKEWLASLGEKTT